MPPKLRRRALDALAQQLDARTRQDLSRAAKPARPAGPTAQEGRAGNHYRCHRCGHEETAYARAERHADEQTHPRIECVL